MKLIALSRWLTTLVFLGLMLSGCQSIVGSFVLPKEGIRDGEYPVARDRDAIMTTSDGIKLVANLYRPVTPGKFPTILVRIPFTQTWKNDLTARVKTRGVMNRNGRSNAHAIRPTI